MPTTEVILTDKIASLGAEADIVKVKAGYARNYLIPHGKAIEVTPANRKRLSSLQAKRAEREVRELNEAEDLARKINKLKINMELETGEQGKAFGSITAADLATRINSELGIENAVDRHRIHLEKPIKEAGAHEVVVKLHHDVSAKFNVTVNAKGSEEAEKVKADEAAKAEEKERGGYKAKVKARHNK
jgi:large subunit ribosomal protein L9